MDRVKVKLVSKEGETFEVDTKIAGQSNTLVGIFNIKGYKPPVKLTTISSSILKKVIQFCTHIKDNPAPELQRPIITDDFNSLVSPFFIDFFNVDKQELYGLAAAGNHLSIKSLLNLSCAKIAASLKGMDSEMMRDYFQIQKDFTPEEESIIEEEKYKALEFL